MRNSTYLMAMLVLGMAASQHASANQIWQASGGTVSVSLLESNIKDLGFSIKEIRNQVQFRQVMEGQRSFPISPLSTFSAETIKGKALKFLGGDILSNGGFKLSKDNSEFDYTNFLVRANTDRLQDSLVMLPNKIVSNASNKRLDLKTPLVTFDWEHRKLSIQMMDVAVSNGLAQSFLRTSESGVLIGLINIELDMKLVGGDLSEKPDEPVEIPQTVFDAGLSAMSGISQSGHVGTFPTGRAGFGISTTSCGMGTGYVPWFAAMNPDHPMIAQNLYRLSSDGRFEQIGESYLKHGFTSTNSPGCSGSCGGGSGNYLSPGCSDTYGAGLNSNPFYLGPRNEVNPLAGTWNCTGSLFANFQPDCVDRRSTSTNVPNGVDRRIDVRDADLNESGATFVYEAYYIVRADENRYNQIGWRRANANWTGSLWNLTSTTALVNGPAINSWGDMRTTFGSLTYNYDNNGNPLPLIGEGECIVAVRVTSPSSGRYLYDYAVYNHTLDRQVKEFIVPVESGLTLNNVQFKDVTVSTSDNWAWEYNRGRIRFYTPTGTNTLKFGNMYNFRFEVNSTPRSSSATLVQSKTGVEPPLTNTINGPLPPQPITISGVIALQDWSGGAKTVNVELRPTWGDPAVALTVPVAADGTYSITTSLRGTYDIAVKGSHWLRSQRAGHLSIGAENMTGINLSLINGDVDNDNEVGPGDFGALSSSFGSVSGDGNWNAEADLDGDGEVGPSDFGILSANFGSTGDN